MVDVWMAVLLSALPVFLEMSSLSTLSGHILHFKHPTVWF